ncbi:uncharacterized protein BJ171DRAFT_488907 [Polychytrium aggregatum]|uniref:uncharacterized protein n=1 Tax=Polychytrium aggregatum TaxID=110093 RepID=UPI0022FEE4DD|nr:uncharacterized protein BJ171DRAFT_488907 [Polychytrium aggregatum]KAI9208441.1 hypothetical protein BJ171DRAFT_488907 [Polychytrium aggregatum]
MADEDPFYVSVRTNIVAFLLGSVLYALSVIILVNYSSLKLNLLSQIELSQLFNSQILAVSVDSSVTLLVSSVAFASSSSCFVLLPATELYRFTLAQSEQPGMYPLDLAWLDWDLVSSLWSYSLWSIQLSIYFFCPFAYFFNESFGPWSHRFRETSLLLFIFWIFLYGFIYLGQSTFTFVQSSYFKSTDVPLSLLLNSVVSTLGLLLALAALPIGMLAILTKPLDLLLPLDHNSRMAERLLELDFAKASLENRLHDLSSKLETLDNPQRTPSQALSALAGGSSQRHKSTTTTTTTIASAMAAQPKFTMYSRPTRLLRREIVQSWRHIERLESERQQIGQELGHLSPYWRLAVATVLLLIVWFAFLVTMAWIQLQFLSKRPL